MSINQRQQEIIDIIQANGAATVIDLSKHFNVSTETIRRDFRLLEDKGFLIRSYGGAVLNEPTSLDKLEVQERRQAHSYEKSIIGELASRLVTPNASIACDAATTVLSLLHSLTDRMNIVVMTNSIVALSEKEQYAYTLISTGGKAIRFSQYLIGPIALNTIAQYHFDYSFVGARGIDTNGNLYDSDESETAVKLAFLERADKKCLLIDHSKFDKRAFKCWANIKNFDYLVTDRKPEDTYIDLCQNYNVQLIYE